MVRRTGVASATSAGLVLLLLNSAYLAASASPSLFYFGNVVLHMVLGIVLGIVWMRRVLRHDDARSDRLRQGYGESAGATAKADGLASALSAVLLAAGGLCGVAIMVVGAAGRTRWLLPAHIGLTIVGGLPLLVRAVWTAAQRAASSGRLVLGGAYSVVLVAFGSALGVAMTHESRIKAQYRIENP